jgi:hypothetical protein
VSSTLEEHSLSCGLPYPQVVGSIIYTSRATRHEWVHPAGVFSLFINEWTQVDGLALESSKTP